MHTPTHVTVLLPLALDAPYTYKAPSHPIQKGHVVWVPLRQKIVAGIIWDETVPAPNYPTKEIHSLTPWVLPSGICTLITWASTYTGAPLGSVLKMALPVTECLKSPEPTVFYKLSPLGQILAQKYLGQEYSFPATAHIPPSQKMLALTPRQKEILRHIASQTFVTHARLLQEGFSSRTLESLLNKNILISLPKNTLETESHQDTHTYLSPSDGLPDLSGPENKSPSCKPEFHGVFYNSAQQKASEFLRDAVDKKAFHPILLDGLTGSGKTEVYFSAIHQALLQQRQILILLPEISLSSAWAKRFESTFSHIPAVWNSHISPKKRQQTYKGILDGTISVVVGTRSAVFLPFQNLGTLIVDEEHDTSYKQESGVFYNGRDLAVVRAHQEKIPVILASATPSLETWENACKGKYTKLHLPERYGPAELPKLYLIDMTKEQKRDSYPFLSQGLRAAIQDNINRREQTLLYLNRRGFAPAVRCIECHTYQICPACDLKLIYHQSDQILRCHHCGFYRPQKSACTNCNSKEGWLYLGVGIEKIAAAMKDLYPEATTKVVSSDILNTPSQMHAVFDAIQNNEIDIVIGTQLMAKGHDYPNLTLIGILDANDHEVAIDLRATEKAFQLLYQVAGRAGRSHKKGRVLLQTETPEQPWIQALQSYNRDLFYESERALRQKLKMPPYHRLASLIVSAPTEQESQKTIQHLAHFLKRHAFLTVYGPTPAPLYKLNHWYRWRLLIRSDKEKTLGSFLKKIVAKTPKKTHTKIQIDIDPLSFL